MGAARKKKEVAPPLKKWSASSSYRAAALTRARMRELTLRIVLGLEVSRDDLIVLAESAGEIFDAAQATKAGEEDIAFEEIAALIKHLEDEREEAKSGESEEMEKLKEEKREAEQRIVDLANDCAEDMKHATENLAAMKERAELAEHELAELRATITHANTQRVEVVKSFVEVAAESFAKHAPEGAELTMKKPLRKRVAKVKP